MKNWIRRILGITALEAKTTSLKKSLDQCEEELKFYKSILLVGADLNYGNPTKRDTSWAVVCIQGRPDYVNFINLTREQAKDIRRFLGHFHRSNIIVDQPPFMMDLKPEHK